MKAMIFAAGLGTRLKPFTQEHPKALVPVGGVPMLERVINRLKQAGITDFVINVHHFADQIIDFIKTNNDFGVNIMISDERDKLLDTGGGIVKAAPILVGDGPVVIYNADILSDVDIRAMVSQHQETNADVTLLVAERKTSRYLCFEGHRLVGWVNTTTGQTRPAGFNVTDAQRLLAFGGIHIISTSVFDKLAQYGKNEAFSLTPFYVDCCEELKICSYIPDKKYTWFDVGKPETLAQADAFCRDQLNN